MPIPAAPQIIAAVVSPEMLSFSFRKITPAPKNQFQKQFEQPGEAGPL